MRKNVLATLAGNSAVKIQCGVPFSGCGCKKQARDVEAVVAELKENRDRALREYERTCTTGGYEHDFADGESEAYEHVISIIRGKE